MPDAPDSLAAAYRHAAQRRPIAHAIARRFGTVMHGELDPGAQQWWTTDPRASGWHPRARFARFDDVYGNGEFTFDGLWTVSDPPLPASTRRARSSRGTSCRTGPPSLVTTTACTSVGRGSSPTEGFVCDLAGAVTMLRYWASERTLWLADVFGDPEPLAAPALSGSVGSVVGVDASAVQDRQDRDRDLLTTLLAR